MGYDDYSDIRLSGAQTAAPIWAEFMKKAIALPQYSDVKPFSQPAGVVDVQLDKATNLLATPACPETYTAAFMAGTEPTRPATRPPALRGFFSHGSLVWRREASSASAPDGASPSPPPATPTAMTQQKEKRIFWQNCGYL